MMCLPTNLKVEREWKHAGLSCAVVYAHKGNYRCGYVRVPHTHSLHGKDYDQVEVSVHGGLTFAKLEPCTDHDDGQGWWFGFDCAHAGDLAHLLGVDYPGHYWTQDEVERECERLAEQIAERAGSGVVMRFEQWLPR